MWACRWLDSATHAQIHTHILSILSFLSLISGIETCICYLLKLISNHYFYTFNSQRRLERMKHWVVAEGNISPTLSNLFPPYFIVQGYFDLSIVLCTVYSPKSFLANPSLSIFQNKSNYISAGLIYHCVTPICLQALTELPSPSRWMLGFTCRKPSSIFV